MKCPYCAEVIQDEAIKCRYCGEWLNKTTVPSALKNLWSSARNFIDPNSGSDKISLIVPMADRPITISEVLLFPDTFQYQGARFNYSSISSLYYHWIQQTVNFIPTGSQIFITLSVDGLTKDIELYIKSIYKYVNQSVIEGLSAYRHLARMSFNRRFYTTMEMLERKGYFIHSYPGDVYGQNIWQFFADGRVSLNDKPKFSTKKVRFLKYPFQLVVENESDPSWNAWGSSISIETKYNQDTFYAALKSAYNISWND